ncbi:MAG: hypothetical protein A3K10_17920, partial [Bacteroidetes bacterium RIFCSPLOWO2_12_FULL_31_6]
MNVLYLSYDGMTDPLGQSQVIPYLIGLSKHGYKFTIISFEKFDNYRKRNASILSVLNQTSINWVPITYHKSPPVLSTLYDLLMLRNKAVALHKKENFQIVHCRSYVTSLVGLYLKRNLGIKFIFDMRGFWPDERIDGKIWNLSNPLYKAIHSYFKKKESEFLSNADYTISLTYNAKKEIHTWSHIKNQPVHIEVIPCCADLHFYSPANINKSEANKLAQKLNITSADFILSYLGSVGTWYLLDEMLDFFLRLLQKNNNSKFLFITPDSPTHLYEKAKQKGIEASKIVIYSANRNEVPLLLSLSHLSIFFIKPVYSKKASSPTKQGEIMGMGIPLICNDGVGDVGE